MEKEIRKKVELELKKCQKKEIEKITIDNPNEFTQYYYADVHYTDGTTVVIYQDEDGDLVDCYLISKNAEEIWESKDGSDREENIYLWDNDTCEFMLGEKTYKALEKAVNDYKKRVDIWREEAAVEILWWNTDLQQWDKSCVCLIREGQTAKEAFEEYVLSIEGHKTYENFLISYAYENCSNKSYYSEDCGENCRECENYEDGKDYTEKGELFDPADYNEKY